MKKKVLFVLSVLMLASCGQNPETSVTPSTTPSVPSTTPSVVQAVKHAVSVPTDVKGVYVTASVSEAVKDEVVKVTVAMTDPSNYELKTVSVGENVLTGTKDENNDNVMHYEFTMPDADAAITVVTAKKEAPKKDHTVSFEGNGLAYAIDMPGEANTSEIVRFKVAAQSGYEITKVSAKAGETDVRVTGDPVTGYTMVMPDADVTITAEALGAYFEVTADAEKKVFVPEGSSYDSNKKTVADFVGGFKIGDEVDSSTSKFIRAGTEVKLIAKRNAFATNVKYYANGTLMSEAEDSTYFAYKFVMPAKNVELSIEAEQKYINLVAENDTHITSSFYFKDSEGNKAPTTTALAGQTVYIDYACTDEGFKLGKPTASILRYDDDSKFATSDYSISVSNMEGNTYSLIVPTVVSSAGDLKIKGPELELIYKGKEFVSNYKGYNIYNGSTGSTYSAAINADGSATIGSSSHTITSVDETNKTIVITGSKTYTIEYDGDIMWTPYDGGNSTKYNDIYVFVKADSSATITNKRYGSNSTFGIYEIFVDGTSKGTIAIDNINKKVVLNPVIQMVSGADIFETGAKFVVKDKDGNVIKACGVGNEYGTYTNGTDTMILDGDGKVTFNGTEGTYVISGTKVSVTIGEVTTDYTINVQDKTFAAYVVSTDPFYVGTFAGTLAYSTGAEYDCTLVINADKTGSYTYNDTTYTFSFTDSDISGNTIRFTDSASRDVTLTVEETNNLIAIYFERGFNYYEGELIKQ